MEIRECLSVYLESGYLFDDMSGRLKWFEIDKILISFTYGVVRYVGTWGGCRTEKTLDGKLFYSSEECFKKGESIPKTRLSIYDVFESLYGFIPIGDVWKYKNGRAVKDKLEYFDVEIDDWVNPYKPEEERFALTLTDEERLLIEERIKAGYYSAENIEKRREEAHKAKMMEKRAEICEQYDKIIRNAETDKKVMLCVFDYGLSTDNIIYYNHTNTLPFNWRDYGEKITQEEFDDFVNNVDRSQLPEGIKFKLK